jgi:hypothetical protein
MKIILEKLDVMPEIFLRDCGYRKIENPHKAGEASFIRSLNFGQFYPRFHIYFNQLSDDLEINIHLDMKKPSYEGATAHSGEYDGELVEKEALRIRDVFKKSVLSQNLNQNAKIQKKKSFWDKIFGDEE